MKRSLIRDLARKKLKETTAAFWSDDELNQWINDACQDLAQKAKCVRGVKYASVIASTAEYVLSTFIPDIYAVTQVYYDDVAYGWRRLTYRTVSELDEQYPGWREVQEGAPQHYFWDDEEDVFGIYPVPGTGGTNDLRIHAAILHTDLTGDEDIPHVPAPLHLAIVDYLVATGNESRGWEENANGAWNKYFTRIRDFMTERGRQKEDQEIIMRNYRR